MEPKYDSCGFGLQMGNGKNQIGVAKIKEREKKLKKKREKAGLGNELF